MHLELKQCEFAVDNVRPSDMVFFTGFSSIEVVNAVLEFLNPEENVENVNMTNHDGQSSETFTEQATTWLVRLHQDWFTPSARGRPRKRTPKKSVLSIFVQSEIGTT